MNVAFDPWIPVVTLDGQPKLASLREVLTEGHLLADLAVRPHERVSLMRLFLCVAHAALDGPKDYDEWQKVPARLPGAAKKYLDKWKDSFDLFHPTKPWLQIAGLKSGKGADEGWGPVSKLAFFRATGANTTLFDHEGLANDGRSFPLWDTVLSLLTFQCFSPGGLISQVVWGGTQTTKSSKDGPCVSASMVHGLVRRGDLARTVQANLPTHEDVAFAYGDRAIGRPVWEQMPSSLKDGSAQKNATESYVGRLVPLTRVVRLHKDGRRMLMGDGLAYPPFSNGFPAEPTAVVVVRIKDDKPGRELLDYRPGQALWRELAAMIVKRNSEGVGGPLSLRSLGDEDACDLMVCALARKRGQATIVDTTESVYAISPRLRTSEGCAVYEAEAREAEEVGRRLGWAVEDYRRGLDGGWKGRLKAAGLRKGELLAKLRENASTQFWTSVEASISLLFAHVDALGSERASATRDAWRAMLSQAAREAYQAVCGQETPRQIKAFTEGWRKLLSRPKKEETALQRKGAQQ
jgi:CRISPR system Cascade subunit CasA